MLESPDYFFRVREIRQTSAGLGQKLYAWALFIMDGLGHTTWSSKMPVSRAGTAPF